MSTRDDDSTHSLETENLARVTAPLGGCRLVVTEGPDAGFSYDLPSGVAVIGKGADCEVRLGDPAVSSRHLQVEVGVNGLRVTDLGSKNGTYYLGSRLEQVVLPVGAVLRLGRTRVLLASPRPRAGEAFSERDHYGALIGEALPMRRLYATLERLEKIDCTVLIHGETGTGKELVAQELHLHSARGDQPYEILDCAAIPSELAEAELFGHERGAYTGAVGSREGAFSRAHGGTLLLDEIGELPLELQPKLLRVLESRQLMPVGGSKRRDVDVRVLAATNRDLAAEVAAGRFRQDLFFRLNVVTLEVPPLRARREDIPILVRHFLTQLDCESIAVTPDTIELFTCGYDWPGNVRELRNAIQRVVSLGTIPDALQAATHGAAAAPAVESSWDLDDPFLEAKKQVVDAFERDYLQSQLDRAGGNMAEAARLSGMDRSYFRRLLLRHGLS